MREYKNGGRLIESEHDLPRFDRVKVITGDYETASGNPRKKSTNPWHHCDVAGFAFTVDDAPGSWYLPIGHKFGPNVPRDIARNYVNDLMRRAERWDNHNIKYDMHVQKNYLDVDPPPLVCDTLTASKLIDSDRQFKGGYGLDALSKHWLKEDISRFEKLLQPYLGRSNMDYGRIPSDIIGEYGCQDAITGRRLGKFIRDTLPEQCAGVFHTECELTTVLYEMERVGLRVDPTALIFQELRNCSRMSEIDDELTKLVGYSFRPHVNADCFDVLCNKYGLPVLLYTEEDDEETGEKCGGPSFNKAALEMYMAHPLAPHRVIKLIKEFRERDMMNRFVKQYRELNVNGLLHSFYNQSVRTGRMSCGSPNMQQLNSEMKRLILAHIGCAFMSADYSQIEMRTIAHYIQDPELIRRYNEDENTDMHEWVASLQPGLDRDAGKTLNFSVAFGLGKEKTVKKLATNPKVAGKLMDEVKRLVDEGKLNEARAKDYYDAVCFEKGLRVYSTYHNLLPGIKQTSYRAADSCKAKGYVFNIAGRRRHIPADKAHIAFNTVNQSSAADIMKERTVALHKALKGTGLQIVASVHDETLVQGPTEAMRDERTVNDIAAILETNTFGLRVPIKIGYGVSDKSWFHAAKGPKYKKNADDTDALDSDGNKIRDEAKSGEGGLTIKTGAYTDFAHLRGTTDAAL